MKKRLFKIIISAIIICSNSKNTFANIVTNQKPTEIIYEHLEDTQKPNTNTFVTVEQINDPSRNSGGLSTNSTLIPTIPEHIILKIVGPCDVVITKGKSSLNTISSDFNNKTDFGNFDISDTNKDLKIFKLYTVDGLNIKILGNSTGYINYSSQHFNQKNEMNDERNFLYIPIKNNSIITTKLSLDQKTALEVDTDGDGFVNYEILTSKSVTNIFNIKSDERPSKPKINIEKSKNSATVSLSSYSNSKIYYTTDGTSPALYGKLYSSPIKLGSSALVKAFVLNSQNIASEISLSQIIIDEESIDFENKMYQIKINYIDGNKIIDSNYFYLRSGDFLTNQNIVIPKNYELSQDFVEFSNNPKSSFFNINIREIQKLVILKDSTLSILDIFNFIKI